MSQRKQRKSVLPAKFADPPDRQSGRPVRQKRTGNETKNASVLPSAKKPKSKANQRVEGAAKKPKSKANQGPQGAAKFVVGIDFGTTFSGFAYASMDDPGNVYTYENWPKKKQAGASRYGKTQTSLRYLPGISVGTFELQDWGWPAFVNHCDELQQKQANTVTNSRSVWKQSVDHHPSLFFTNFKLYLADGARDGSSSHYSDQYKQERPPEGLSVEQLIADYLRALSTFAMEELKKRYGSFIRKTDVKWCLTVPTIWTDSAKHTMRICAEMAGLVHGPHCQDEDASSEENFAIVLEPEAASVYCLQKVKNSHDLKVGSKVLVVDAGGGTVDLVVHEIVDDDCLKVKEVTSSTGDLCGGTFVDMAFKNHLAKTIGCFEKFSTEHPYTTLDILDKCNGFKCSFGRYSRQLHVLDLPAKLSKSWEENERTTGSWSEDRRYEEVVITGEEMTSMFDGQVKKILKLMNDQLMLVPKIEAIFVVDGFSNSFYLMERIRAEFAHAVKNITSPTDPEYAVCKGAVLMGTVGVDIMMSRKSKKTYGVSMFRPFTKGDPPGCKVSADNGKHLCKDAFDIFARIGDDVPVNYCVRRQYGPFSKGHSDIVFTMFSTTDPKPRFVTDNGVKKIGTWTYQLPLEAQKMKNDPSVAVEMYFGRSHIEMSAEPLNFVGGKESMFSVSFDSKLN